MKVPFSSWIVHFLHPHPQAALGERGDIIRTMQRAMRGELRELAVFGEGLAVIRYVGLALFDVVLPRLRMHISGILADILVIVGYIAWGFLRLNLAGVEFTHLFATSAVLTAVLAISMQDTLGNLLGGLALQMDNSLEIGDWIEIGDVSGKVSDIQWRYTAIVTRNGERVVIPNSHLMKNRYVVVCNPRQAVPQQRRLIDFNVDLSVPPARVTRAVLDDIQTARIANVSLIPAPICLLHAFGDGYAQYQLRYWLIDPGPDDITDSDVRHHVLASLQREGIRLAVGDQTIHLVQENKAHREEVRNRELKRRVGAISRIDLFARLSEAEQEDLARRLINAPFAKGDVLFRQGDVAHWLYIIASGEAEAWWTPPRRRAPAPHRHPRPRQRVRRARPDDRRPAPLHRRRDHRRRSLPPRQGQPRTHPARPPRTRRGHLGDPRKTPPALCRPRTGPRRRQPRPTQLSARRRQRPRQKDPRILRPVVALPPASGTPNARHHSPAPRPRRRPPGPP